MGKKGNLLIVDDSIININVLSKMLSNDYNVKTACNGKEAIDCALSDDSIDLILLDIIMPGMDGYEVCKILKNSPFTSSVPIIFLTSLISHDDEKKGLDLGAVDYITKPVNASLVKARVRNHIKLLRHEKVLREEVRLQTQEIEETRRSIIQRLTNAIEYRVPNESCGHILRVCHYSQLISKCLGLSEEWQNLIYDASAMHDVGMLVVPDRILSKDRMLMKKEMSVVLQHPKVGANIIGEHHSKLLKMAREIALTHHERWDGSGYPFGMVGADVPLHGRIVAVADVFDSLTNSRSYSDIWSVKAASRYINENSGKLFDPDVVSAFNRTFADMCVIKERYSEHFSMELYTELVNFANKISSPETTLDDEAR